MVEARQRRRLHRGSDQFAKIGAIPPHAGQDSSKRISHDIARSPTTHGKRYGPINSAMSDQTARCPKTSAAVDGHDLEVPTSVACQE